MQKEIISIRCADDYHLAATIYRPEKIAGAIMIAPATGIKRTFYNSFATYLAEHNYGVICYDNRGIGNSASNDINQVDASLVNWGRLDMTAVLEQLKIDFPNHSYHIVGHSAGGQLVGLMPNAQEITSIFNFACSSGSLRNMPYPFKLYATFYLNLFIPLSNFIFGKTNSQWVGMGEPLPKQVAQQWSKWCNGSGYVAMEFGDEVNEHLYNELNFPSCWVYAADDPISNRANVEDMIRVFPKLPHKIIEVVPKDYGKKSINHMGFFSSKNRVLWTLALDWLNNQ